MKIYDLPEFCGTKPSGWTRLFKDYLIVRQGGYSSNPLAQEMALKSGEGYNPGSMLQPLINERALSKSDLPDILQAVHAALPPAEARMEHRQFTNFIKAPDFYGIEVLTGGSDIKVEETMELKEVTCTSPGFGVTSKSLRSFRVRTPVSRQAFINGSGWMQPLANNIINALVRQESALVYSELESATISATDTGTVGQSNLSKALSMFRSLTTNDGAYLNARPTHYIVPPSIELAEHQVVKDAGLNITVVSHASVTACYLLSDQMPCITRFGLNENPIIEYRMPPITKDWASVVDGLHDTNCIFSDDLAVVKVEL